MIRDPFANYDAWKTASPYDEDYDDSGQEQERELDAYGHLTWTIGDENYLCCLDAIRIGNEISYHVVINCESPGAWIDTVERGTVRIDDADAIARLKELPQTYAGTCIENEVLIDESELKDCEARWVKHIEELAA